MSNSNAAVRGSSPATGNDHELHSTIPGNASSSSIVLRVISSSDEGLSEIPPNQYPPAGDWSDLVNRVRTTAARVREVEANAEEQEFRVREILEKVREDIKAANDRVQAAEAHALDIQKRAGALLAAADERVKAAEERARVAESWLSLVKKTFAEEFKGSEGEKRRG